MDIQIDPAVGRVLGIVLSIAIAGILGSLLFGRWEDDKEKDAAAKDSDARNTVNQQRPSSYDRHRGNSESAPSKLDEEKDKNSHEPALLTRIEDRLAKRNQMQGGPKPQEYGITEQQYAMYLEMTLQQRQELKPQSLALRLQNYESALESFAAEYRSSVESGVNHSTVAPSEENPVQEMYERGIARIKEWTSEQGQSTPEQRVGRAKRIAERQLERLGKEQKQRAEEAERRKLRDYWLALDGRAFEEKLAELYRDLGYERVELTPQSGDHGVDLILRANTKMTVVQCKRQRQPVGPAPARELYGAMMHLGANDAILVSTSRFTSGVLDFVKGKPIKLLDIENLVRMSQAAAWNLGMGGDTGNLTID